MACRTLFLGGEGVGGEEEEQKEDGGGDSEPGSSQVKDRQIYCRLSEQKVEPSRQTGQTHTQKNTIPYTQLSLSNKTYK